MDRRDPNKVAAGFVVATWAWDTRIDTSPFNAQKRASQLATSQYAKDLQHAPQAAPGATWNALEAKKGYTRVTAKKIPTDDAPPATKTTRILTFEVTVTGVGAKVPTQKLVMFLSLHRPSSSQPWQVASSTVSAN